MICDDLRTTNELMDAALANHLAGRYGSARSFYTQVLAQEPDNAVAHMNLGTVLLTLGEFEAGWREFSWRRRLQSNQLPVWDGTQLDGKGLLVRGEQGAGDNIQFMRYLPMVSAMGGQVSALT
ncbi:MAG: tetratricopeptide repeat protein, partial [Alphaproteobacteria bacterium]|nr:tetratricopeptide repeat protein [Alphaproteobacteria bacterium]